MHGKQKTKQRLPVGVVEKLQKNPGGGAHRNQKTDYKRHHKHRNRDESNFRKENKSASSSTTA